jgi:hypothetical protein
MEERCASPHFRINVDASYSTDVVMHCVVSPHHTGMLRIYVGMLVERMSRV